MYVVITHPETEIMCNALCLHIMESSYLRCVALPALFCEVDADTIHGSLIQPFYFGQKKPQTKLKPIPTFILI